MAEYKNAVLTHAGAELVAEAIAGQFVIEFVKMVIGDGEYEEEEKTREALQKRTELKSLRNAVNFSSVTSTDDRSVKLKAVITNEELETGYRMTEIGIIAKRQGDTESGEVLYSVAVAIEADYLPDAAYPISYTQEYYTHVSNAENVVINVDGTFESVVHPKYEETEELTDLEEGDDIFIILGKIKKAISELLRHKKLLGDKDISEIGDGTVTGAIALLKKSVSDGKELVAGAITEKGVETAADATFAEMADNIANIKTNPTLQAKTASLSTSAQTIKPDSGYDGLSQVTVPAITGTAAVGEVLAGKTFNSATAGIAKTGTMTNWGTWTSGTTGNQKITIPAGYHNGQGYVDTAGAYNAGNNAGYSAGYNAGVAVGQASPSITQKSYTWPSQWYNSSSGPVYYTFDFPHGIAGVVQLSTNHDEGSGLPAKIYSISGNTIGIRPLTYNPVEMSITVVVNGY